MRIDTHVHYFPRPYIEEFAAFDQRTASRMNSPMLERAMSLDWVEECMTKADIDQALIGIGSQQPYFDDEDVAVRLARLANDQYVDAISSRPNSYFALGCLPLPHVEAAVAEARRCLRELNFKGIAFGTRVQDIPLDDARFEPVWAELDAGAAIAQIHPLGGRCEPFGLDAAIGGPDDICISCARLCLSGVTTRYPNIRFIAPCLGGGIPYYFARIERFAKGDPVRGSHVDDNVDAAGALRRLYYDTESATPEILRCTCDTIGLEQIVFGTNHPFENIAEDAKIVAESGLSNADVEKIMSDNPRRLLGLD